MENFKELFPSFKNYTESMYLGNEYAYKDGNIEHWNFRNGQAQTKNGNLLGIKFDFSKTKSIQIIGDKILCYDFGKKIKGYDCIFKQEL